MLTDQQQHQPPTQPLLKNDQKLDLDQEAVELYSFVPVRGGELGDTLILCAMAVVSSAAILYSLSLPSRRKSSPLEASQASQQATNAPEPPRTHRRSSSAINIPPILANILHLHLSDHIDQLPTGPLLMPDNQQAPAWSPKENISSLRPQLHGTADWSPLIDPLHPWLRREILKYGEFAQATYDAFDFNPFSQFCGSCLYSRSHLFDRLGLSRHGYSITKYLYATSHLELPRWLERSIRADSWSDVSNWIGFVAVSDDKETARIGSRDIVVAWRGTIAPSEWLENLQGKLEALGPDHGDARVEHGFRSIYTSKSETSRYNKLSASEQVMGEVRRLVELYTGRGEEVSLTITGHSMGGALAVLSAYEAALEIAPGVSVSVVTFGGPRVGNEAFKARLEGMGVKVLRVVVKQDVVPRVPGILFNEGLRWAAGAAEWVYTHVGVEMGMDVRESPYLKRGVDLSGFHSLETHLHLVDGYLGSGGGFRSDAKRDPALVNKASGLLREELRVPASWYQAANKGMERNAYGRWVQPHREADDIPSPDGEIATPCFS